MDQVDFATGRVRPNLSWDASTGLVIARAGSRALRLQADMLNIADRLNVINFAGLFSGTALAPPRSVAMRLQFEF